MNASNTTLPKIYRDAACALAGHLPGADLTAMMDMAAGEFARARLADPDWFRDLEDLDTSQAAEVEALLHTAPTPFCAGFLYGQLVVLRELQQVTGRSAH